MVFELSPEEMKELRRIQQKDRFHRRRFVKATVLIMLHRQLSIEDIEVSLGIDDNTVRRYVKGYRERGLKRYMQDGYIPYCGKLSEEQEQQLAVHLDEFLYPDAWAICAYVKDTFGVEYTVSGMTDLLHRLGYVYKKSRAVPAKAEEAAQLAFLEEQLPPILAEAERGEAVVYYADGCHPTHNTKTSRGWIRKGQDFEVDCKSGRKRVNINAAINALQPEHELADTINAQSTQRLCRRLLKKHAGKKIYLICDNAGYNRNTMLSAWTAKQRIELVYLPTYSPNLNLIERLWHFMRLKIINSTYYPRHPDFRAAIDTFLQSAKKYKTELRSLLTLNFRTVGGRSYHLSQTTS